MPKRKHMRKHMRKHIRIHPHPLHTLLTMTTEKPKKTKHRPGQALAVQGQLSSSMAV